MNNLALLKASQDWEDSINILLGYQEDGGDLENLLPTTAFNLSEDEKQIKEIASSLKKEVSKRLLKEVKKLSFWDDIVGDTIIFHHSDGQAGVSETSAAEDLLSEITYPTKNQVDYVAKNLINEAYDDSPWRDDYLSFR